MLGQAGRTLEKQIAWSDPPRDHRPARSQQRARRADALRAGGRGRRLPTLQHRCLRQSCRVSVHSSLPRRPFPSMAWEHDRSKQRGPHRKGPNPERCRGLNATALRTTPPRVYATSLPETELTASPKARRWSPSTSQISRIRLHRVAAEDGLLIFSHYLPRVRRRA